MYVISLIVVNIHHYNYSVFRNGDLIYQGARVLLSKRIMASLENVCIYSHMIFVI